MSQKSEFDFREFLKCHEEESEEKAEENLIPAEDELDHECLNLVLEFLRVLRTLFQIL